MDAKSEKLRAAVYTRVSSDEQARGYSLGFQHEEIMEMAKKDAATVDARHIFVDDGYTGIHGDRPFLKALIEAAKNKEFDIIYVWKIDRLFRNTKLVLNLVDDLAQYGVGVKSVLEPFCDSSTPIGRYMFTMLAAGAEMEHANINERTYHGKVRAMREGKWLCGTPTYGFDLDKETSKLKLNEEEAKWAQKFYEWFVNGRMTLYQLQQRVNSLGIPTKHVNLGRVGKITSKTFWNKRTLGRLLSNEIYTGKFYYRKYKNPGGMRNITDLRPKEEWILIQTPQIVSEELFALAQQQLRANRENSPRKTKRMYMFAKRLVCGACGHKINAGYRHPRKGTNQVGTKFYSGAWVFRHSTDRACENCRFYSEPRLDREIWHTLKDFLSDPERAIRQIERHQGGYRRAGEIAEEQVRLAAQEQLLEKKEEKLLTTYLEGDINKQTYKKRLADLVKEREIVSEWWRKLSQSLLNDQERARCVGSAKALYTKMRKLLGDATYEMRCKIVDVFIEKITLTGDNAEIEMRIPFRDALPRFISQFNKFVYAGACNGDFLWDKGGVD